MTARDEYPNTPGRKGLAGYIFRCEDSRIGDYVYEALFASEASAWRRYDECIEVGSCAATHKVLEKRWVDGRWVYTEVERDVHHSAPPGDHGG